MDGAGHAGIPGCGQGELRPLSLQGNVAFIDSPDGALPRNISERAYWGDNREELRRIKEIWDKDNFFQWEQGIRLPGAIAIPIPGPGDQNEPEKSGDQGNDEDLTDSLASRQWEDWRVYETKDIMGDLKNMGF